MLLMHIVRDGAGPQQSVAAGPPLAAFGEWSTLRLFLVAA